MLHIFSEIANLHSVEVTYSSIGCFHNRSCLFEFNSKNNVFMYDRSKNLVGKYNITDQELKKLDKLIQYYVSNINNYGGCTTEDSIKIEIKSCNEVLEKLVYEDHSCMVNQLKGVMTFSTLLSKIEKATDCGN